MSFKALINHLNGPFHGRNYDGSKYARLTYYQEHIELHYYAMHTMPATPHNHGGVFK